MPLLTGALNPIKESSL